MSSASSDDFRAEELVIRNKLYREDIEYVVKICKSLLTPIGIWPGLGDGSASSNARIYVQVSFVFCLMLFLLAPHFYWTFFDAEDLRKLMKIIAAQVFNSLAILKFWTFMVNKRDIRYCLEEMERDYKSVGDQEQRAIMVKNAKIGRFFTIAYLGLSYGGALPYHVVMPLLQPRFLLPDNSTRIPLPYPTDYVFFDPSFWSLPCYAGLFFTQIAISTLILSTNCGVYSFIASCVMHAVCLFEIAAYRMGRLLSRYEGRKIEVVDEELRRNFAEVIRAHCKAMRFADKIESALTIVMLAEMAGCTIIICFLEYGVLLDLEEGNNLGVMTYVTLINSIVVNVFILSYVGDKVKEQSFKVGEAAYALEWYNLPHKFALRNVMFIVARANQPTTLTAGKLFDLSLEGFMDVVKTSAAYLNFLRTLEIT